METSLELRGAVRALPRWSSLISIAVALAVLVGWVFDIPLLRSGVPHTVTIKVNTALGILGVSSALAVLAFFGNARSSRWTAQILALASFFLGAATLVEYATTLSLGIDQFLVPEAGGAAGTYFLGRMSFVSAFGLIGLATALTGRIWVRPMLCDLALSFVALLSYTTIVAWVIGAPEVLGSNHITSAPLFGSIVFVLLVLGTLAVDPERGVVRLLISNRAGSISARRLIPLAIVALPVLAIFREIGEREGWFSPELGAVLLLSLSVASIVALMIWSATLASRIEAERDRAHEESEQRFRSIAQTAADAIITIESSGRISGWNPASEALLGYRENEIIGQPLATVIRDLSGALDDFVGKTHEIEATCRSGAVLPLEISLSTWTDLAGIRYYTAISRDVSARVAIERERAVQSEQLARRTEELQVANAELEAFSYSVSHDLRAPLRAIDGFAKRLVRRGEQLQLDDAATNDLQRVCAAAQRMGDLIDDLLKLSRLSRRELRLERIDLSGLAQMAVDELSRATPERAVDVAIEPGLKAAGDPSLIAIALENLLGNAWKFTAHRSRAQITLGCVAGNGSGRKYFVRDNGAGFDMRYADKLFQPFQRLHSTREFDGNGIGLATVSRIFARHGGRIWAEAEPNVGATFYFTIATESESA